ncbi:hypothetical protein J6590_046984 [Homalodisca vitripennis]|nr:hypothetical protein J6590_046984 [Homalodisca vitripennis]
MLKLIVVPYKSKHKASCTHTDFGRPIFTGRPNSNVNRFRSLIQFTVGIWTAGKKSVVQNRCVCN